MIRIDNNEDLTKYKINMSKENAERDELGYAVSWKRALSQLYNYTSWLHGYCVINYVAAQKVVLRLNKTFEIIHVKGVSEECTKQLKDYKYVTDIDRVIELRRQLQTLYSIEFTNGHVGKAKEELESRMKGNRSKDVAMISFHLGMMVCLVFIYFLLLNLNSNINVNKRR
jgi:UPF0288 family protein (methanogenesis marker protein 3)